MAVALVVIGYALGPAILARSLSDLPPLGVVAASLAIAAVAYLPAGIVAAPLGLAVDEGDILAVLGLAVICTAVAFLIFFKLIAEVGPARSTVITYVNPAVAVLLGVAGAERGVHGGDRGRVRADPARLGAGHPGRPPGGREGRARGGGRRACRRTG